MRAWLKLVLVIVVGLIAEMFLFPVKMSQGRGRHPSVSAVSQSSKPFIAGTSIPKQIHHTWKTPLHDASKRIKRNVRDWDSMNPGFESNYYTDKTVSELVYENFPDRTTLFERLNTIQRADLFRYLVLFHRGGIYADVDVQPELSADEWVANAHNSHEVIITPKMLSLDADKSESTSTDTDSASSSSSPQESNAPSPSHSASSTTPQRADVQSPAPHRTKEGDAKVTLTASKSADADKGDDSSSTGKGRHRRVSDPSQKDDDDETIGCMVGTEIVLANQKVAEKNKYIGPIQFTQWAIACSPQHPILLSVLDMIEEKVQELTNKDPKLAERRKLPTLETTGPFVWTRAVERYLKTLNVTLEDVHKIQYERRGHSVRVGDVLILAPCKFGRNKSWPDQCVPGDMHFLQHEFMGSWKVSEYNLVKKVVFILLGVTVGIVVVLTALYRLCKHHLEDDEPKQKFVPHPLARVTSVAHLPTGTSGGGTTSSRNSATPSPKSSSTLHTPTSLSPRASHGGPLSPYSPHHHSYSHSHSYSHAHHHHHHSHSAAPSKSIGVSYSPHYSLAASSVSGLPSALTSSVSSIPSVSTLASSAASALSLSSGSLTSTTSRAPSRVSSYSTMPRISSSMSVASSSHHGVGVGAAGYAKPVPRASNSSLLPS